MKKTVLIIFTILFTACSPLELKEVKNVTLVQWKDLGIGFLLATKEESETFNDLAWIYGDLRDHTKTFPLFNEWRDPNTKKPIRRLWFGPETQKLVEWSDENQNGIWETKTYFNQTAKTGVHSGHIAFADIDTDEDGTMDFRIFLGARVEDLIQEKGTIRVWAEGKESIEKIDRFIRTKQISDLGTSRKAPISESWALHPEKVTDVLYKPVYQP
ncbi:hypothetical protein P3G55_12250 [Leptospira sp. 96542]|nr:hypothetical protein [Leptospira sp. 96542]